MKEQIIEFLKGIGTIILFLFLGSLGSILFGKYYYSDNIIYATLSQIATYLLMLIIIGLIYHKRLINDFKNFKKDNVNIALKNWLIGLGAMIIANIIITNIVKDIPANETLNRELLTSYPISNIITMIFIGPLIEEIVFRASFKNAFHKWYIFSFVTALIFGLAHIAEFNLLEFLFVIPYGSLGFFLAKAFYETDNIYTSYLAHMLHNALSIIIIFAL